VSDDGLTIVLFGAVGDLAERKLLPALWHALRSGALPGGWRLVGTARSEVSDDEFRATARDALDGEVDGLDDDTWSRFAERLTYHSADLVDEDGHDLAEAVMDVEPDDRTPRLYFLSVPPPTFAPVTRRLADIGLLDRARVIFEKPYGLDLASFDELEAVVDDVLDPAHVFRLDHFLGKQSVQELYDLRRASPVLEELWRRDSIERIELDVPETLGVGDRAGFYDDTGALRDVVSTHLLQVAAVVAMDLPASDDDLPAARAAALEAIEVLGPHDVVYGQYDGYLDVDGVEDGSTTETFAAATVRFGGDRWAGVRFHLRHAKCMAASHQRLTITFSAPAARRLEGAGIALNDDRLVIELDEPDTVPVDDGDDRAASAHERLILAALAGDHRWFPSAAALRRVWQLIDPVLREQPPVDRYEPGTWGPERAERLVAPYRWSV